MEITMSTHDSRQLLDSKSENVIASKVIY